MAAPIYVSKLLAAASSTAIGTLSSGVTIQPSSLISSSNLDTQRRIQIAASSGSLSAVNFTITGTREGGTPVTETITGPTSNVPVRTTSDFLSVSSIVASCSIASQAIVGTSSVAGSPWKLVNWYITPMSIGGAITFSSSGNGATGVIDITMDDPTGVFPDPNNPVPVVLNTTTHIGTAASTNTWGALNADLNVSSPITAWRLTVTSTSTSTTISAQIMQAGVA